MIRKYSPLLLLILLLTLTAIVEAGPVLSNGPDVTEDPFAHTFSIVAIDKERGEMGVAVQSHWFSVGPVVPWAEPGVGVIATQSLVNISYGPKGLEMLRGGMNAPMVVTALTGRDEGRDYRQLAIIDVAGNVATYTGTKCIAEAGHVTGKDFSVQANMMLKATVWDAMAESFRTSEGPLAERMLLALQAAQAEGGDIRGMQSAAIIVVSTTATDQPWNDKLVDLRVEDSDQPLEELARLLNIHRAYEHMNAGDLAIEASDFDTALKEYSEAERLNPDNPEMTFWHAVSLANVGEVKQSLPLFRKIFNGELGDQWRELTARLPKVGLLEVSEKDLKRILKQE